MEMSYAPAHTAYRSASVQTATPERLLIMLYDGLIRLMKTAQSAIVAGDVPEAHKNLIKSQDIVIELKSTLKMEYEISHALAALYDYFLRRLQEANVSKTPEPLEDILPRVEELREAWVQAAVIVRSESANSQSQQAT